MDWIIKEKKINEDTQYVYFVKFKFGKSDWRYAWYGVRENFWGALDYFVDFDHNCNGMWQGWKNEIEYLNSVSESNIHYVLENKSSHTALIKLIFFRAVHCLRNCENYSKQI